MKLASLRQGRDGRLIVVSRDLTRAVAAQVPTLQAALDDWDTHRPALADLATRLEAGRMPGDFELDCAALAAPLPRAYQWADGSAYVNHVELVRKARGVALPDSFWHDPLMYQGGSDTMLGPRDDIVAADEAWGIDLEGEVAVVTADVPAGCPVADALAHVRLLMLVNDVSLRGLIPAELNKGFGFFQGKPPTAFGPVAVTPDELGDAWRDGKVHLDMEASVNGGRLGLVAGGVDMVFSFADLIAHAARTRPLGAGTVVGSGTLSNKDRAAGSTCLAERRMIETIDDGAPRTPFLRDGDTVRIDMRGTDGASVFGVIEQRVRVTGAGT